MLPRSVQTSCFPDPFKVIKVISHIHSATIYPKDKNNGICNLLRLCESIEKKKNKPPRGRLKTIATVVASFYPALCNYNQNYYLQL